MLKDEITIRDLIALVALHGLLSGSLRPTKISAEDEIEPDFTRRAFADSAYLYADAMISSRNDIPKPEEA